MLAGVIYNERILSWVEKEYLSQKKLTVVVTNDLSIIIMGAV